MRFQHDYRSILQLFDLVLTLPTTSTACERGFSHMKLIKTDIRNSLSENTLSNGILIRLHSAPIDEFDPVPAIEYWLSQKERRPGTSGSSENKEKGIYSRMSISLIYVSKSLEWKKNCKSFMLQLQKWIKRLQLWPMKMFIQYMKR